MENKPKIFHAEGAIILKFPRPPTQEEFDYWAARVAEAIEYANKMTGGDVHIIGWEQKES